MKLLQALFDTLCSLLDEESVMLKAVQNTHLSTCQSIKPAVNEIVALIEHFSPLFKKSKVGICHKTVRLPLPPRFFCLLAFIILHLKEYLDDDDLLSLYSDRHCWMMNYLVIVDPQLKWQVLLLLL